MRCYVKCMAASPVTGREQNARPSRESGRTETIFTGARECSGRPIQTGQIQARGFSSSARPRSALSQQSSLGKPDEQNAFAFVGEDNQEQASGGASDRLTTYQQPEEQQQRGVLLGVGPAAFCWPGVTGPRRSEAAATEGTGGRRARGYALAWEDRDAGGRAGERPFAGLPGRVAKVGYSGWTECRLSTCVQRRCGGS